MKFHQESEYFIENHKKTSRKSAWKPHSLIWPTLEPRQRHCARKRTFAAHLCELHCAACKKTAAQTRKTMVCALISAFRFVHFSAVLSAIYSLDTNAWYAGVQSTFAPTRAPTLVPAPVYRGRYLAAGVSPPVAQRRLPPFFLFYVSSHLFRRRLVLQAPA